MNENWYHSIGFLLHLFENLKFLTLKKYPQIFGFLVLILSASPAHSQSGDVDLFVTDMLKIADNFASPAAEGAAYQGGAGWFTSAESLGLWEFDFSIHANVLFVPESKKSGLTSSGDYATFDILGAETAEIPTAFGGSTDVIFDGELEFLGNTVPFAFQALEGVDKTLLMHPFLQASVGVPFGTDVTVRFLPQVAIDDVKFSTYGIGLKHNFNQYSFNPQPTDWQFAALVSYSKFDVNYEFIPVDVEGVATMDEIEVDAHLFLLQLITSKRFRNPAWNVFGAIGVTNSDFGYVVGGEGFALQLLNKSLETLDNNEMEFKGDLGVTYDMGDFLFSTMFSQGKFSNLNLSLHYKL